jgi:hypothetical protein
MYLVILYGPLAVGPPGLLATVRPVSTYRCLPLITFVVDGNNGTMS